MTVPLPPLPTAEMLRAGAAEMRVSTHADAGVALDVWRAMQRTRPDRQALRSLLARIDANLVYDSGKTYHPNHPDVLLAEAVELLRLHLPESAS